MPRNIKAAVFTKNSGEHCEILDAVLADPGPKELIIQVKACGLCHTDIAVAGYQSRPAILGHETAGVVVETGAEVRAFKVGDRVVATFSSCGNCGTCEDGKPAYCMTQAQRNFEGVRPSGEPSVRLKDGTPVFSAFFQQSGFADHALVQEDNLVKIPDGLSFQNAAPLGCGVQTGAGAVMRSLEAKAGQSLVVFGVGAVGLSAVMAAKAIGCSPIIAVDLDKGRLARAGQYGATHTLSGNDEDLVSKIKTATDGGAHYSLEGTGVVSVYHAALQCLRPSGTCGTLTLPGAFGKPVQHPGGMEFLQMRQMGIVEGDSLPTEFIPQLAEMQIGGSLPYDELVTTFAFEDINAALDACRDQSAIKPVLVF